MNPSSSKTQPAGNKDYKDGHNKNNRQPSNSQDTAASQSSLIVSRVLGHE